MDLGEFLRWLIGKVIGFWPQRIIMQWEGGVRFFLGRPRKLLAPGLHWFIPLLGEIRKVDASWDVMETSYITHTINGQDVTFSLGLPYRIANAQKLLCQIYDPDTTVLNKVVCIAGSALKDFGPGGDDDPEEWDAVDAVRHDLPDLMDEVLPVELEQWGLECGPVEVVSCSSAQALRLLHDDGAGGSE